MKDTHSLSEPFYDGAYVDICSNNLSKYEYG